MGAIVAPLRGLCWFLLATGGFAALHPRLSCADAISAALAATHCVEVRHAEHLHPIVVSRRFLHEESPAHVARRPSRAALSLYLGNPQECQWLQPPLRATAHYA